MTRYVAHLRGAVLVGGVLLAITWGGGTGAGQTPARVAIDPDDIGGVVMGPRGPEAGVWVIAETTDLPTRFVRIVVTDDQGRYVVPDLPKATYSVWVRGYGLVDSPKVTAAPGQQLALKAVPAPTARAAAEYYPAQYWLSLLRLPPRSDFPGTGPAGNGISPNIRSQGEWIRNVVNTDGCTGCHQMGNKATREIPPSLGTFASSVAAWERRVQSGQAGAGMLARLTQVGRQRALAMWADWTDRIAAGELPAAAPPRPQGRERNVVVTMWDWADPKAYLHDEIASDKRNPTVNPNGPIYGALEESADYLSVLDPVRHTATRIPLGVRDPQTPSAARTPPAQPSPYWGDEAIWTSRTSAHSFAMDRQARVWIAARIRPAQTPAFCREGSDHPSAKAFPITQSNRQMQMYNPKTKEVVTIDTCFGTHHLNFDDKDVLWFTGGGPVEGWFNTRIYDETGDEKLAQGWTVFVLDTNGNGRRDAYVEPDQPIDPTKDKRVNAPFYGVAPSPADGSIWGSVLGMPGMLVRLTLGSNPPLTALSEVYEVPWNNPRAGVQGFAPRGMDVDDNGVVWTVLSSGHHASFDRRRCKGPLNGPNATGQHCPEGWTLYPLPGPNYQGAVDAASADTAYYNFVDRFNMLGLGRNVPLATGNGSEALLAIVGGSVLTLRVPYPMGFYAKGMDGRIDDPKAGWKGKGIWTTFATRAPFHVEGGKGTTSKVVKFQVRPDPLAK
ncbi:MAG TPA: carboxypeptidase-like regulatory domain-containing protein [Vicinamibacterales bacterium]|nr:carboxypeptidase-like regulatory domain-containing protein [Vicinamibacterales bacterium]